MHPVPQAGPPACGLNHTKTGALVPVLVCETVLGILMERTAPRSGFPKRLLKRPPYYKTGCGWLMCDIVGVWAPGPGEDPAARNCPESLSFTRRAADGKEDSMNSISERDLENLCINTLRMLSADAVQHANSGHPGMPMGAAAMGYTLWTKFLKHNPG